MPKLFGLHLPPCGAEVQVAYEMVVTRLREKWLLLRGQQSASFIVGEVHEELFNEQLKWSAGYLKGPYKPRKPWCREEVFKYQLRWIHYFVREAYALEPDSEQLMTESELSAKLGMLCVVPPELYFLQIENEILLAKWENWHAKKRAASPKVPALSEDKEMNDIDEVKQWNGKHNGGVHRGESDSMANSSIDAFPSSPPVVDDE